MATNGSVPTIAANSSLPSTTDLLLISTTSYPEAKGLPGLVVTCIYAGCYLLLFLFLAFKVYWQKKAAGDSLTPWGYFAAIWEDRAIYAPLLVHIYDTATDFGVLWEWYDLAQIEKEGRNIISLDMEQFFTIAIGFLIAYRILLGFMSWYGVSVVLHNEYEWNSCASIFCGFFSGFVVGSLELTVFFAIWMDSTIVERSDDDKGAGALQKGCQSSEGVLEALPEVIMQSVFYMRAYNDPYLRARASSIYLLVGISIIASLISISSKYIWVDELMVEVHSKKLINDEAYECTARVCCSKHYYISFGYIIRVVWRLSAVSARFVIFALIWVVLGGAFEIVFVPVMVVFWYLLLFFYVTRGHFILVIAREVGKDALDQLKQCCDDCKSCLERTFYVLFGMVAVIIGGVVLQLGIAGIAGSGVYILRVIENVLIMIIITVFAFVQFDCKYCADSVQRQAWDPFDEDGNKRISVWIVNGWIAITVHIITSLLMTKVVDEDYNFNVTTMAKEVREEVEDERRRKHEEAQERRDEREL